MSSSCSRPVSASTIIDSTMTFRRVEISSDYQRPAAPKDISTTVFEEPLHVYNRPNSNYAVYDDDDVKDESVWRSNSGASIDTQFGRVSTATGDSGYSCQPSITSLDSPMPYIQSEDGSPYSRPTSSVFSRPTSLDVSTSDYDSNVEIMDSPTIPSAYHHFDDTDNYCAGFPRDRGCIS